MHARHLLPRIAAIAVLCASLGACDLALSSFNEQATDTWAKKFPLSDGGRLEVKNTNGFIRVEVGSDQVEVSAERVARAATPEAAKEMLKKVEVLEDVTADRVRLETRRPQGGFGKGSVEVRYTIRVPASAQVELANTNGEVRVTGVTRGTRISTTNGAIDGRGLAGEVRATTTNGGVDLELASFSQPVHVSTTNGGVSVRIPSDAKADLQATCTNGGIDVSGLELDIEGERTRRRLAGRLNGGGPRIDVSTTNGAIEIRGGGKSKGDS
jgi:Putative adhesin